MSVLFCSVVFFTCSVVCATQYEFEEPPEDIGLSLFSGLDAVLKYFRTSPDPLAQKILTTFEKDCFYMVEPKVPRDDDPHRRPIISVEGNYRPSRDSVGSKLANLLDGRYLNNPAPCLVRHLQQLTPGSFLRRAYYILSLYASDFNIRVHLSTGRAVVLNGGWLDQLTFTILQTFDQDTLPNVTSELYQWPNDLLRPDISVYLTMPDGYHRAFVDRQRGAADWQKRSLILYNDLQSIYPIIIQNSRSSPQEILKSVADFLGNKRDVSIREPNDEDSHYAFNLFSGLDTLLSYLRNSTNPIAHELVDTFNKDCHFKSTPEIPRGNSRKPFIVIEGNGHTSRDIVAKAVARKMNARYMIHPATCLIKYLDIMPKGTTIRRAYYALSLYAVSSYIRAHLSTNRAVVLNGYWLDQVSFSLIQSYPEGQYMPQEAERLFQMPEDLIKPDLIFYLHLSDEMRNRQPEANKAPSWYTRALEMYQSLQGFYPIIVENLKGNDLSTADNVYQSIKDTLSNTRNVVRQDYGEDLQVLELFGGLDDVLNYFRNSSSVIAKDILKTYEEQCEHNQDYLPGSKKPFIVLEGNNRTSRGVVAGRLARVMQGISLRQPAQCLRGFVHVLPRSSLMRRAFFILSLYATSADIRIHLNSSPVFLNGYWLDQLTFALIQTFPYGRLPPLSSGIFKWPKGLLQPDLTVYLNYPDELQKQSPLMRSPRNWKPRALELYQQLQSIYNIRVYNMTAEYWKTSDEIYQFINYNLFES